ATTAQIQAIVDALPDINPGDALVTGRPVDPGETTIQMRNNRAGVSYLMHSQLGWWMTAGYRNSSGTTLTITRTIVTQGTGHITAGAYSGRGRWYWYVVSYRDGDLIYSGGSTTFRQAGQAGKWPWWYSQPATLTVSRPDATDPAFDGTAPLFQWAIATDASTPIAYQEINYVDDVTNQSVWFVATSPARPDGSVPPVTDTTLKTTDVQYRLPHNILKNPKAYRAGFRVYNEAGQESFVDRDFSITFTPPSAPATFTGSVSADGAYADLAWTASTATGFAEYRLAYRLADAAWDGSETTFITFSDSTVVGYRSLELPLNTPIVVGIFVHTVVSGSDLYSVAKEWTPPGGKILNRGISGTVLSQTTGSGRTYVVRPGRDTRSIPRIFNRTARTPWGAQLPVIYRDKAYGKSFTATYHILWDDPVFGTTVQDQLAALDILCQTRQVLLYRDGLGERFYCVLTSFVPTDDVDYRITHVALTGLQVDPPVGLG